MRVLAIHKRWDRSETELFLRLAKAGVQIEVLTEPSAGEAAQFEAGGISVMRQRFRHRLDLEAVRAIRNTLAEREFHMVHALHNRALSTALLATLRRKIKVVGYRGTIGHLSRFDPASWLTYLNPRVDRIICVSDAVRRYLLGLGISPAKLVRIYKGHDIRWYETTVKEDLTRYGLPPDAVPVGFVGNMRPVKGVEVLIRSAHRLPPDSRIHYLLVGEVRDRRIGRLARDPRVCGRIHLTGFRAEGWRLMGSCRMTVMPSLEREGLPRAVIEAMAQGIPVVVSRVGGMPELVEDGQEGAVVPPGDAVALAEAVQRLAADPATCSAMGQRAKRKIETRFHIEQTVRETLSLYEQLLR
jgi:glycosyltransferase involved in cell wall biosynthesis